MWKRVTARHGAQFVKHVVPAVVKPARILWNEIIGFLFLCIGVMFASKVVSLYRAYSSEAAGESDNFARLLLALAFTLVMLYFAATSFWRARKISRS